MAKVSVIIPTANRAALVGKAVSSVLSQTYQDFEIIIVDDGSTDQTFEVLRSFGDPRIKIFQLPEKKGAAGARNHALKQIQSDYVAFLDDDDSWLPEKLEKQFDLLDGSSLKSGLVHTGRYSVDLATGTTFTEIPIVPEGKPLTRNYITTSSVLMRRQCFLEVGEFDESFPCASDYDMWIRVSKRFRLAYIPEPLVHYSIHQQKLSTNFIKRIQGREALLRKHKAFFEADPKNHSSLYLTLGILYCSCGERKKGMKAFQNALLLNPTGIKTYYYSLLSMLPTRSFCRIIEEKQKKILKPAPVPANSRPRETVVGLRSNSL